MPAFICTACGMQYPPSEAPPGSCPICTEERQFVPAAGQSWTTLEKLRQGHSNKFRRLAPGLTTIETTPTFGIGQRAILARTPGGNVLWDCIALVDDATVDVIKGLGGVKAIAISHPHYYTTMVEWSEAFGGVPVYLHEADRKWIMRSGPSISLWKGETKELLSGLTLICCGGHYPGGTVLHWPAGAGGKGALLSGDIVQVVQDNKSVSFMWSFPNIIPLSAPRVEGVVASLKPYAFDRIHGAFADRTIWSDGKGVLERSADRYLKIIRGDGTYELQ
jgi:hypothetical protein